MRVILTFLLIISMLIMESCVHDPISPMVQNPDEINLKWNQSYPNENVADALTGLYWCLSHVGAQNTNPSSSGIEFNDNKLKLRIASLGFTPDAKKMMEVLHQSIINSPEYIQNNSIDIGRYITLLIGSSDHYYRITGIPEKLGQQLDDYSLLPETGFVNNSSISSHHRTIQFSVCARVRFGCEQSGSGKQLFEVIGIDSVICTDIQNNWRYSVNDFEQKVVGNRSRNNRNIYIVN